MTDTNGINSLYNDELPDHRKINFCVVQPTTPANYFHVLRRQMLRNYRKPLVVITPKIGLRHPAYVSNIEEFSLEYKFKPIIYNNSENTKKVLFCTGQVYLEINKHIESYTKENGQNDVKLIRIEELAPFPEKEILESLKDISKDSKFYWIQEESMNVGAYSYTYPHLRRIMRKLKLNNNEVEYIGREAQCAANGCVEDHKKEVIQLNSNIKKVVFGL